MRFFFSPFSIYMHSIRVGLPVWAQDRSIKHLNMIGINVVYGMGRCRHRIYSIKRYKEKGRNMNPMIKTPTPTENI